MYYRPQAHVHTHKPPITDTTIGGRGARGCFRSPLGSIPLEIGFPNCLIWDPPLKFAAVFAPS